MTAGRSTSCASGTMHRNSGTTTSDCQYLNAADRLMLVAHKGMRGIDHAGFLSQTHVWLRGRLDPACLKLALARLHTAYPVVTARLDDPGGRAVPCWRHRPEARPVLHESTLLSADDAPVLHSAERLFEQPLDHDRDDPLTFHLLHLPDGRDVFLLRFSHVLMDGKAPEYVLKEINRLFQEGESEDRDPHRCELRAKDADGLHSVGCTVTAGDEMQAHLLRFDRKRRVRAALRVVRSHIRWPQRPAILTPRELDEWLVRPYGIALRQLTVEQTDALLERAKGLLGFANPTPLILAAAFRAVARHAPLATNSRTIFQTDLPLNLRPPGRMEPIFRNFMSFIQIRARADELNSFEAAARLLNTRMRDQLRSAIDLGNLQMMHLMAPHARLLHRHILTQMKNQPFTLGFGFLGPATAGLEHFCGQEVDRLYSLNSAISPPGTTLQAIQFRGRLNLMLTFIESAVPRPTADLFLDRAMEDLIQA